MSTLRSIFTNTAAVFAGRVAHMAGSFAIILLISRALHAEGLGVYSIAIAFYTLAELTCDLGLTSFVTRELAKDLSQTNRYLIHAGVLALASGGIVIAVLTVVISRLGYSSDTVTSIYLLWLALVPNAVRYVLGAIFISHRRADLDAYSTLIWTIARVAASVVALRLDLGIPGIVAVYVVTSVAALLTSGYLYVRKIDTPRWEFDRGFLRSLLLGVRSFAVLAVAGSVFNQSETVILSWFQGATEVGFYGAAFKLVTLWYIIPQSFMSVVFPVLTQTYQHSRQRSELIQERAMKYLLALGLPIAIGGFGAAEPIIRQFYGPGFEQAILVYRLLTWHTALAFLNNVLWRVLLARDREDLAVRVQIVSGILRIVLSFLLVPGLGALGAALALMGGYTAYTLLHVHYVRTIGAPVPLLRTGWRPAFAAAGMGGCVYALGGQLGLVPLVGIGVVVYVALFVAIGGLSTDERELLRRGWRRLAALRSAKTAVATDAK